MVPSPVGWIGLVAHKTALCRIYCRPDKPTLLRVLQSTFPRLLLEETPLLERARKEMSAYFAHELVNFSLPLDLSKLSPFASTVLRILADIPYGKTITYGALAAAAGKPLAARAIGRVMAGNPFPIVIPCHRVVGTNGKMTGYSGGEGIATKEWLLKFESDETL